MALMEAELYRGRFSDKELAQARGFWRSICRYLQQYVDPSGSTVDLGAGYCHFINNIASRERIAVDINAEALKRFAGSGVRCIISDAADLSEITTGSVHTVFASNVYEHFSSREAVLKSFQEAYRILRPGGRFLILQPNFAHCYRSYFDFFDHRLAFTHLGIAEGVRAAGFEIERLVGRFLPYTSKSRLPKSPWLVSLYLRMPVLWRLLGQQMLIIARKPTATA